MYIVQCTFNTHSQLSDTIEHYVDAKHVALYSNGKWYVLNVITGGRQLTPIELQKQIQWIEVCYVTCALLLI